MTDFGSTQRHPLVSIILLLFIIFIGAIVFTLIGAVIGGIAYGFPEMFKFLGGDMSNLPLIRLIQIFSSIGTFIVPAIVFARLESVVWQGYLKFNPAFLILFILTVILMFFSSPLLELSVELNRSMKLPALLSEVEEWMRRQEDQMAELTKKLLTMNTIGALMVNLLMLAVIPAIGEELIFRGCFQKLFSSLFNNHHLAIWLTAIIFSAIHMQFYGFIPRMLLGAMFGYLLVWSNSIWLPILGHFVNNATAVLTAYVYQQQGKDLELLNQPDRSNWGIYLVSLIVTFTMLWTIYKKGKDQTQLISQADGTRLG